MPQVPTWIQKFEWTRRNINQNELCIGKSHQKIQDKETQGFADHLDHL